MPSTRYPDFKDSFGQGHEFTVRNDFVDGSRPRRYDCAQSAATLERAELVDEAELTRSLVQTVRLDLTTGVDQQETTGRQAIQPVNLPKSILR